MLTEIWEFCAFFWKILCLTLTAAKKSVLPAGWVPRKSVEGKVVLVTGAGNGLGRLMAIEFAKLGARLVLWDIDEEANKQTKEALDQLDTGYEAFSYRVDLACKEQIYAVAEQVKHDLGSGPDILVNNAGIAYAKEVLNLPDKVFDKTMAVNCNALFYTAKAFLPEMVARRQGHIVNIASMAGIAGVNRLMAYCVSKHGAIGFSDTLRAEMSAMGLPITVTTVCPYYVNTNMTVGIQTFSRLLPIMDADYVVHRIMDAVLTNADELYLPWAANLVVAFKGLLPVSVGLAINEYLQIDRTTEAFQGAEGAAKN